MIVKSLRYTKTHEWIKEEGNVVTIGITDYAQEQLTEVVYAELPEIGKQLSAGDTAAVLESVKSVSDIYAPVTGRVAKVNAALVDTPDIINTSPYDEGWIFSLEVENIEGDFMDADAYQAFIGEDS